MAKKDKEIPYYITTEKINELIVKGVPIAQEIELQEQVRAMIKEMVPESIIDQAKLMGTDIEGLLFKLVQERQSGSYAFNRERTVSLLAGIVGNALAKKHFESQGCKVEEEVDILEEGSTRKKTSTDLVVTDKDGNITLIEVKTIPALITTPEEFPEKPFEIPDSVIENPAEGEEDKAQALTPGIVLPRRSITVNNFKGEERSLPHIAVSTAEKAKKQVEINREYANSKEAVDGKKRNVALCVFEGIKISPEIEEAITTHADIIRLPINVDKVFDFCYDMVGAVVYQGRNIMHPSRGRTPMTYEERYNKEIDTLGL